MVEVVVVVSFGLVVVVEVEVVVDVYILMYVSEDRLYLLVCFSLYCDWTVLVKVC